MQSSEVFKITGHFLQVQFDLNIIDAGLFKQFDCIRMIFIIFRVIYVLHPGLYHRLRAVHTGEMGDVNT